MPNQGQPKQAKLKHLILIVDDDLLILGLISNYLQEAGYDVRMATSGQMALDMVSESGREPDLALLDINMPGMSGIELARLLLDEAAIPFMILSASDDDNVVRQATACGALGYLLKPVDPARILPGVRAALARAAKTARPRASERRLALAMQTGGETGMAVGVLMERHKTDRQTAFQALREHARLSQRNLNDVANEVIASAETLNAYAARLPAPVPK
ncbi:MAG: response regulator [Pseudomonadota bacterium]